MKEEIQNSIGAGYNDYLNKPLIQAELINLISRYATPEK